MQGVALDRQWPPGAAPAGLPLSSTIEPIVQEDPPAGAEPGSRDNNLLSTLSAHRRTTGRFDNDRQGRGRPCWPAPCLKMGIQAGECL